MENSVIGPTWMLPERNPTPYPWALDLSKWEVVSGQFESFILEQDPNADINKAEGGAYMKAIMNYDRGAPIRHKIEILYHDKGYLCKFDEEIGPPGPVPTIFRSPRMALFVRSFTSKLMPRPILIARAWRLREWSHGWASLFSKKKTVAGFVVVLSAAVHWFRTVVEQLFPKGLVSMSWDLDGTFADTSVGFSPSVESDSP